ncbi:MAG: TldD/PmbA family protein [Bryobacterales bacterium]|nr:TldD/PmbA family protein [Bryobacterales bacterium]
MKSHRPLLIRLSFYCIASILMNGVSSAAVSVLGVMEHELDRSVKKLAQQPTPLYFLSYEITEEKSSYVRASFGTISASSDSERRLLDIDLRVGDYSLDNTHPIRERFGSGSRRFSQLEIPVSGIDALRNILWYQTDRKFKDAIERLTMVKANVQVKVKEEDRAADFSAESPEQALEDPHSLSLDRSIWEDKLKQYTSPFSQSSHIYAADAALSASVVTRWYVNSDGSKIRTAESRARLMISALTKAEDGMELPRYESFFSFDLNGLPDDSEVMEKVHAMIRDLEALRVAPIADPYTGPAILSGRASGVFFHEILGHRVEGHRQKSEQDSQTFKKMLGQRVLPETFTVVFDPTVRRIGPTDLAGSYRFDNQGVKAQRVAVIEDGTLRRFLMSRTPIDGFSQSNGHGRKQAGYAPVSRQSNLFVEVSKPHSREALKAMLIERLNAENKEFGLFFEDIQGGFTTTGRMLPNAFNVLPIMVYRIYADGREELVRGVDLIGTPLTTFSKVAAASDQIEVFNGTCGAESGGVPVSAASPAVLVSQIEVQKKEKSIERLPLLPAPPGAPHSLRVAAEGGAR